MFYHQQKLFFMKNINLLILKKPVRYINAILPTLRIPSFQWNIMVINVRIWEHRSLVAEYSEFITYLPRSNRIHDLCTTATLLISQNLMLKSTSLTHRFICHAHISRRPATKSTGQMVGFLHGGLGWVIWKLCGDACCPSGEGVHTARTVKAVGTSKIQ